MLFQLGCQFVEFLFDVGLEGFHFLFAFGFALFFPSFVCLTCHFFLRFYCCQYVLLGNDCILPENNGFETVEESIQYSLVGFLRQNNDCSTAVIQFFGCIFQQRPLFQCLGSTCITADECASSSTQQNTDRTAENADQ